VGGLLRRLRAKSDYVAFIASKEWPVLVAGTGVLLGAATVLPSSFGVVLSVVALGLGVASFARDVRLTRARWSTYEFSVIAAPFPHADVPPPARFPDAHYLAVPGRGTALVSAELDEAVRDVDRPVLVVEEPYRLPPFLRATAPHVLPLRARGRTLFNGRVVGLLDEPVGTGPVRMRHARFFDGECSNELCSMRIVDRVSGEEFDPRRRLLTDPAGRVRTLAESDLADLVGISTLALTTDDHLVLIVQSQQNTASPLLLAPSGSGSLEPRDLAGTLDGSVRNGMERELREETGLRPGEVGTTRVVGFARWMERGAKPEFFGVTTLTVSSAELRGRGAKGAERIYSSPVLLVPFDLAAVGRELAAGADLLECLPERVRDDGSLPLLLAIRAAALAGARRLRPQVDP
jgi:8-oxo-dGTP pyrophosphatase MutT (NUDIX family)